MSIFSELFFRRETLRNIATVYVSKPTDAHADVIYYNDRFE